MENTTKHFCTCSDRACAMHPANHGGGCDPCIAKNLGRNEVPACIWNKVGGDMAGVSEYTIDSFVAYCNRQKEKSG